MLPSLVVLRLSTDFSPGVQFLVSALASFGSYGRWCVAEAAVHPAGPQFALAVVGVGLTASLPTSCPWHRIPVPAARSRRRRCFDAKPRSGAQEMRAPQSSVFPHTTQGPNLDLYARPHAATAPQVVVLALSRPRLQPRPVQGSFRQVPPGSWRCGARRLGWSPGRGCFARCGLRGLALTRWLAGARARDLIRSLVPRATMMLGLEIRSRSAPTCGAGRLGLSSRAHRAYENARLS